MCFPTWKAQTATALFVAKKCFLVHMQLHFKVSLFQIEDVLHSAGRGRRGCVGEWPLPSAHPLPPPLMSRSSFPHSQCTERITGESSYSLASKSSRGYDSLWACALVGFRVVNILLHIFVNFRCHLSWLRNNGRCNGHIQEFGLTGFLYRLWRCSLLSQCLRHHRN